MRSGTEEGFPTYSSISHTTFNYTNIVISTFPMPQFFFIYTFSFIYYEKKKLGKHGKPVSYGHRYLGSVGFHYPQS